MKIRLANETDYDQLMILYNGELIEIKSKDIVQCVIKLQISAPENYPIWKAEKLPVEKLGENERKIRNKELEGRLKNGH